MKILNINYYFDPAGVGENLVKAINKHTEHEARHIMSTHALHNLHPTTYSDILYDAVSEDELASVVESADILHINNYDWSFNNFIDEIREASKTITKHINPNKHKIVFHGHGGSWLLNPEPQIQRCKDIGASVVMCGAMDSAVVPESTWLPNVLSKEVTDIRTDDRNFDKHLTVSTAPNHSQGLYKGSKLVESMVTGLRSFGYNLRYAMITGVSREGSLSARQNHHFTVDNWVQGFHGMVAIEGLALGHVVFSRFDPLAYSTWADFSDEMIPIIDVKGFDTCAKYLRDYCNDRDMLAEHSKLNKEWVGKHYTEEIIVNKWVDFYEGLLEGKDIKISSTKTHKTKEISTMGYKRDSLIVNMFDETALMDNPMDGIMGNDTYLELEKNEIGNLLNRLKKDKEHPIDTDGNVLDAGCGVGRNIEVLKNVGFSEDRIEAIDFSPNMLLAFKENYPNVVCSNMDLRDLSTYPDDYFETTFCMYVLIHITDEGAVAEAISELERVTKGLLIIGQSMDPENKSQSRICKVREYFELHPHFKKKQLHHFYKNVFEFRGKEDDWDNRVSFAIYVNKD